MHREALSRSLLYSHNLIGKPTVTLTCRSITLHNGGAGGTPQGIKVINTSSPRRYHRSWDKQSQSVTKTVLSEATTEKGLEASLPLEDAKVSIQQPAKIFNLKAKDILSTPDEPFAPAEPFKREDSSSVANHMLLETKIFSSQSVEGLLKLSTEPDLTLKHGCLIISRLGSLAQARNDSRFSQRIVADKRFVRVFNLIQRGNHSQFPHTLLLALSGIQKLGMETSSEVSQLLERELSWSMRRCPLRFLAKSVRILHDNPYTNPGTARADDETSATSVKEENVLQSAVQVLQRRWIEAINGSDFISLFQVIDLLDDEKKLKLEERAADVVHQFSAAEMIKIFVLLSTKKRRPTPLLRAMSYHFSKSEHKINAKEAIELIYALNELTFADPILMNRLCTDLAEDVPRVKNNALISSLMTSLGQMRYKNKDILLAVDEWIMKHLNTLRVFDFASWLQACATLNYQSPNIPGFCEKARKVLTLSSSSCPTDWVNIVHSFVVLNEYNMEMLSSVLDPAFVDSIDKIGAKSAKQKLKLLNLNHIASQRKENYSGRLLDDTKVKDWTLTLVTSSDGKLSKLVVDSLANFLPPKKYLTLSCQQESGVFVDAMCYFDSKMTPITLEAAKSKKTSETTQVGIVVEGYSAMCLGLKDRTGASALNKKILESDNVHVITIPYTEFGLSEKLVKRVQYLEQKIKSVSNIGGSST